MTKMNKYNSISTYDVQKWWDKCKNKPGGKWIFSKCLGIVVPYSNSIKPYVHSLDNGVCCIFIKKRRTVCNHINTVHAAALGNLIELAASLAILSREERPRCVVSDYNVRLLKPARTNIWAMATVIGDINKRTEGTVVVRDSENNIIARGTCAWRVWK